SSLIPSYFCFYGIVDFLFLTKHISVELFRKPLRIMLLLAGCAQIYQLVRRLLEQPSMDSGEDLKGPLSSPLIFYVTLLTVLSSSIKFLNPTGSLREYMRVFDESSLGGHAEFIYALLLSVSHSLLNAFLSFLILCLVKKYKNYFINNLTIINNMLLSITGILILLA
ncbi:MAG: hypothetical protein LBB24_01190, partial [Rickettsiales bacterium]|nr:hypothetical protein [Rickettsiales bacterium]